MKSGFDNVDLWVERDSEGNKHLVIACRDKTVDGDEEKWVSDSLSMDEAKRVYEYLGNYFD